MFTHFYVSVTHVSLLYLSVAVSHCKDSLKINGGCD